MSFASEIALSTLYELHAAESVADFSSAAVALMDAAFPGSLITFDRIDADTGRYEVALNRTIPDAAETTRRVGACVARDNPLVALIAALPRSAPVTPYRLSDHLPPERFWRTELYAVGFAPFGARYQLAVALRGGDELLAFGINRSTDFSDSEAALAAALGTHVRHAHDALLHRLALEAATAPSSEELSRLSSREGQVWRWLRAGRRNPEIAELLGLSRSTVKRHCENIYAKLGIRGRTAARRENPGPSTHGRQCPPAGPHLA